MKRFVLYSEEMGVYIGSAMGLGFWSKIDPVGQDSAVTFQSEAEATRVRDIWNGGPFEDVRCVEVECGRDVDGRYYASIAQCVRAGLPAWVPA